MQIILNLQAKGKEAAVAIGFNANELKFALAVLKGIQQVANADFVKEAIDEITLALKPKQLPMINYFRICELCSCEFDERINGAGFLKTQNDRSSWQHYKCPDLKQNRPN